MIVFFFTILFIYFIITLTLLWATVNSPRVIRDIFLWKLLLYQSENNIYAIDYKIHIPIYTIAAIHTTKQ